VDGLEELSNDPKSLFTVGGVLLCQTRIIPYHHTDFFKLRELLTVIFKLTGFRKPGEDGFPKSR
jgi:hypothetical protein